MWTGSDLKCSTGQVYLHFISCSGGRTTQIHTHTSSLTYDTSPNQKDLFHFISGAQLSVREWGET